MASAHRSHLPRIILQSSGLALMLALLGLFAAGVPVRARQLSTLVTQSESLFVPGVPASLAEVYIARLRPAEVQALQSLGLSVGVYTTFVLAIEVGQAVACAAVGLFILWRRSADWLAVWMALVLALLGTTAVAPEIYMLSAAWPGWELLPTAVGLLGTVSFLHVLYLVPDGRFVPSWTGRLAVAFAGAALGLFLYVAVNFQESAVWIIVIAYFAAWIILSGVGLAGQMYRYRRVLGPVQRQQVKWVAVGLAAVTLGILINGALMSVANQTQGLPRILNNSARITLVNLCLLVMPVSLAFSILRYRLWDIDLIIRRTLIYGSLTAALVVVYFGSVVLLQSLVGRLTGQSQSELVTVLSTLAIAAVFVPLRRRVQNFIDRRFYRRKYDATQVLAAFGTSLRDETDLARLSHRLEAVVEHAMQPASTTLWLKSAPPNPHTSPTDHAPRNPSPLQTGGAPR